MSCDSKSLAWLEKKVVRNIRSNGVGLPLKVIAFLFKSLKSAALMAIPGR